MYTVIASFNVQLFFNTHIAITYIHGTVSLLPPLSSPCSPCYFLLLPFVPLSTYLAPSSCDRNCPPPSQVACKLTLFAPPSTQSSRPFQFPRTPTAQRSTTTTLGLIRSCYAEQKLLNLWLHMPKTGLDSETTITKL
jgi:hypothetical protein